MTVCLKNKLAQDDNRNLQNIKPTFCFNQGFLTTWNHLKRKKKSSENGRHKIKPCWRNTAPMFTHEGHTTKQDFFFQI